MHRLCLQGVAEHAPALLPHHHHHPPTPAEVAHIQCTPPPPRRLRRRSVRLHLHTGTCATFVLHAATISGDHRLKTTSSCMTRCIHIPVLCRCVQNTRLFSTKKKKKKNCECRFVAYFRLCIQINLFCQVENKTANDMSAPMHGFNAGGWRSEYFTHRSAADLLLGFSPHR